MRLVLFPALLALGLGSQALAQTPPVPDMTVQRGAAIAESRCTSCHQIGPEDGMSRTAPSFSIIALRHTPISLERQLGALKNGHYEMPPLRLETDEIRAIVAYMESLR